MAERQGLYSRAVLEEFHNMCSSQLWITAPGAKDCARDVSPGRRLIATLGPVGTSSEYAALWLARYVWNVLPDTLVKLFCNYEDAASAVIENHATELLVANAYANVSTFYMDPRLNLVGAFILDTPRYGLAAKASRPIPQSVRIATHQAPKPLIRQLLPDGYLVCKVIEVPSTGAAAEAVVSSQVDLALTTDTAVSVHNLKFVSRTRKIRMVWSVFRPAAGQAIHDTETWSTDSDTTG